MGFLDNISAGAGSLLSGGLGFLGSIGSSIGSSLFNANQAKINRKFQERMYNKQVEDNIKFWNMQNEYNLPSAQRQRLEDAGLNPLLMYGEGGIQNVANSAVQPGTAPHGAQASSNINAQIELANLALVREQAKKLAAETEETEARANESRNRNISIVLQNEITERTKDASVAIANKNVDKVDREIEWLASQELALDNMSAASVDNLMSMVEFRKKYYDIDNQRMLNDFWYQVESIAIGRAHVSNELKTIALGWYNAKTQRKLIDGQLEVFEATIKEINSRTDLNDQEKTNKILDAYNTVLKNTMLENIGTDNLGGAAGLMLLLTGKMSGRI